MNTFEASLSVCKIRPHLAVPFALKPAIECKLHSLEEAGIIQKVAHCLWGTPVVSVLKGCAQIRLCGDYKVTIYSELENDQYPLPKPEELFGKLAGGKRFPKIDLTYAYQEMSLEESSHHKQTQRGVPIHTDTFWGGHSSGIVSIMDTILQGINKGICYINCDLEQCGRAPTKSGKCPKETPGIQHWGQEN